MSIKYYYPEMDQPKPDNVVGEVSHAYGGDHYFVKTSLELKGRGIKFVGGLDMYRVTNRAMEILEAKYDFSQELLLD